MTKKKTIIGVIISLVLVIMILLSLGTYYLFFDINRIKGDELIATSISPDNTYTIEVYRNSGGATTDCAVLCKLHYNNENKKDRNVYWDYHVSDAEIEWTDDDTVIINGKTLNDVTKDKYDFRLE